jgi:site-specific DNA-methyltransferase (adenine-specific)
MNSKIIQGNNVDVLKTFPDNHFDSIVTDPPYGIDFLGKAWDANTGALETYQECLRVLKPGGHILAFSAARTYHHLAVTIEQAGFEIRDQIMWIYSSGFPKSQDIGKSIDRSAGKKNELKDRGTKGTKGDKIVKNSPGSGTLCPGCGRDSNARYSCDKGQECGMVYKPQTEDAKAWTGWGTQLKPAHEPIVLARKPIRLSIAKNCQQWGVGAINIDATRVPYESEDDQPSGGENGWSRVGFSEQPVEKYLDQKKSTKPKPGVIGRDPRNNLKSNGVESDIPYSEQEWTPSEAGRFPSNVVGDIPDYQKYFYCPKVSRRERHVGHETPPPMFGDMKGAYDENGERYAVGLDARAVIDRRQMVEAMGGKWVNDAGEHLDALSADANAKSVWLPHLGMIYAHGLTHEYAKWCKDNNKDPGNVGNNHPTVKPIELMKYLIKLVTPAGGRVLDPFNGSGSTGCAAVELDYDYTGIELDEKYVEIAEKRIQAWYDDTHLPEIFEYEQ